MEEPGEDRAKKQEQQNLHYFYLNELQNMARDLPGKYQQRLPYDLLTSLASSLLDGTVFAIIHSLKEVQQLEERNLSNQRIRLNNEHKAQKQELQKKHRDMIQNCQNRPHHLPYVQSQCQQEMEAFERHCEEDIKKRDMKIILELDQKVMDQQSTLEKAGVPGFCVTNSPPEVRMQMYLLEFVVQLAALEPPGS